jgi:hypothetical protein
MLNFGILWKNARNLLYIKKFNDKRAIRLANDKLETKKFLSVRWIPFAKTYAVIKNRKELFDIDFEKLPNKNFVVKPNRWSKWKWIYVTKFLWSIEKPIRTINFSKTIFRKKWNFINKIVNRISKTFRKAENKIQNLPNFPYYYEIAGEIVNDNKFRRHILDNLDWKNSMITGSDNVIVEEKIIPGEWFKDFCEHWLADIRVIAFNLVPINAMVRMPTYKSEWKANLARWWIWLWIDIGTWKIKTMFHKKKLFKWKFPQEFKNLKDHKLPYWDDILFLSSKIQYFVNLWYLALDWVITDEGPKLLEINARAWLEVQNISWSKLKNILNKISDLKISDPEKWVEIAKSLFSQEKTKWYNEKILYLSQYGKFIINGKNLLKFNETIVKVNINKSENYVSKDIFQWLKDNPKTTRILDLYENDIHIKNLKFLLDETLWNNQIILWKDATSNYLIKAINKTESKISIINTQEIEASEKNRLHTIDEEISKIWKKLILAKILKPINYFEELDKFILKNWKYNPIFNYKRPEREKLDELTNNLLNIKDEINKKNYNKKFSKLFDNKIEDLFCRINLIKAYKSKDYKNILLYNEKLYEKFDKRLLNISKNKIFEWEPENKNLLWKELTINEVKKRIEKYLEKKWIEWIDIIITSTTLARMSITMWKKAKIKINRLVPFQDKELNSILAHEIDTHLIRYINWARSGWNIFKEWSWFYLKDEEGLAIYNSSKYLPSDYEKLSFYKKYFLLKEAQKYSFSKLVDLVRFLYPEKNLERIFNTILKLKKWVGNTSTINEWAIFMKDKVYLDWYIKIKDWAEKWWEVEEMYKGKFKVEDLDFML